MIIQFCKDIPITLLYLVAILIPTSQSQVRDQVVQSGSVPNTFFAYEELEKNSNVDSDSRSDSSTDDKNRQLRDGLKNWAVNYNIA